MRSPFPLLLLLLGSTPLVHAGEDWACNTNRPGAFSYYKLAISVSQEWCIANRKEHYAQCSREYVLHGLWPQCRDGYPSWCRPEGGATLDRVDLDRYLPVIPSRGLMRYQWEKHGACSGLDAEGYLDLATELYRKIRLPHIKPGLYSPKQILDGVVAANKGVVPADAVELACDEGEKAPDDDRETLDEIRICFDRAGEPTTCLERERSCWGLRQLRVRSLSAEAARPRGWGR